MFVKPNHLYEHPALIFPPLFDLFVCVSVLNSHLVHCFDSLLFMIQLSLHLQAAHWDTEQRVTMATSLSLLWEYDISIYIYKVYIISVLRFCLIVFLLFEFFVIFHSLFIENYSTLCLWAWDIVTLCQSAWGPVGFCRALFTWTVLRRHGDAVMLWIVGK